MGNKLRFIVGASGVGKTQILFEELINRAMKNLDKNYMIVVPEQFTMETQRKVVDMHERGAVSNIDVLSFNRMAFRVFSELGINNLEVLDDTGKSLILRKVIANEKQNLSIYKDKVHMHGFVEAMKSVISELYVYGIGADKFQNIKEQVQNNNLISEKLRDIEVIYNSFQKYIQDKFITKEELLEKLCQVVPKSKLLRGSYLYFDGFTGFTPVQNQLMELLLRYTKGMTISVCIGKEELESVKNGIKKGCIDVKEQELFKMPKDTMNVLLKYQIQECEKNNQIYAGDKLEKDSIFISDDIPIRVQGNRTLAQLEQGLFRAKKKVKNDGSVIVRKDSSPICEVEYAADYIAWKVKKEGFRYRDFAIITGDMQGYGKILEDQLNLRDIPYFMDNKRSLILNPAVTFLRAILEVIDKNFTYESVFRFLKCGMNILDTDETDMLENYCLACGIRGYQAYSEPFRRKKKKMTDEELEEINHIREKFIEIVEEIQEAFLGKYLQNDEKLTVRKMTQYLYEFICRFDIQGQLIEMEQEFLEMGEMSESKEYGQTYEFMIDLFDKLVSLLGDEQISLKEYREILDAGFEEIKVGVIPLGSDQVIVGDIERTRLSNVKILFVLGANDGVIPKHEAKSSLLSQRDRNYLHKQEIELSPTIRESIFIQKFYLYLNLTKPEKQLIVSYAESNSSGSAVRPSYLINELKRLYLQSDFEEEENIYLKLSSKAFAMKYLAENLSANIADMSDFQKELYSYFYKDKEFFNTLAKVLKGKFFDNNPTKLSKAVAKALTGESMVKSISRLEKYAACAYAHFLSYGLQLAEREKYEVSFADIGTLYHRCIELFSSEMMRRKLSFSDISEEDRNALVDECVEQVTENFGNTILKSSKRNEYLIRKIKAVSKRTVWAMCEHIKRGKFQPENFEFSFAQGRIDRLDTYEEDGKLYIKIIDYKSGSKKFDMSDVFHGLQLQLVYYLGETVKIKQAVLEGKEIVPAGTFYFNIKSPYIEINEKIGDEKREELLLKEYKMTGLINDEQIPAVAMDEALSMEKKDSDIVPLKNKDLGKPASSSGLNGENLEKLIDKAEEIINQFTEEILDGQIEKNPYKKAMMTPCDYCSYQSVCNFDSREFHNKYKKLVKISKPEDVIRELNNERRMQSEVDKRTAGGY